MHNRIIRSIYTHIYEIMNKYVPNDSDHHYYGDNVLYCIMLCAIIDILCTDKA